MDEPLKPCPFCGGEAYARQALMWDEDYNTVAVPEMWTVNCDTYGCMSEVGCAFFNTEAEAIEAWNTRHERTCKPEEVYLDNYSDLTVTVCSNCHVAIDELEDCYYCPNCGAKVVSV